ncbi:MAG TPA: ammonium transporter [Methylosinus sp.]|uniref:ammonium transporter n=1 Tax=Methylosinus sp. TaxID=427 RepID=UPI002F93AFA8
MAQTPAAPAAATAAPAASAAADAKPVDASAPAPAAATAPAPAASAATAPADTVNKGDTAWMIVATLLVIMMSIPGLALFYGGLVRSKNMLSILMQVFVIFSLIVILWTLYGYSVAFTAGNPFFGSLDKIFMKGVTPDSMAATFSKGVAIPEFMYMAFQATFAAITVALVIGSLAERARFSAVLLFAALWFTFSYLPIAHMVWYWDGPDGIVNQAGLDKVTANAGWLWAKGAMDFAGGTVVHINAGIAGLVGAIIVGKRIGYGKEALPPHSLTLSMVGASLLWVGWFGFNAGSNLEANGTTALAFVNTMVATAAAALSWLLAEWALKGKPSLLGLISGAVAGLVAVTPASGFAGPIGSIALGFIVSPISLFFVSKVKNFFGYDDSLDVFGVHAIGGITGALATGILVSPDLGGVGITDYTNIGENFAGKYDMAQQMISQATAVGATILYSGIGSAILYKIVDVVIGLRVAPDQEREGLDIAEHGERAYNS